MNRFKRKGLRPIAFATVLGIGFGIGTGSPETALYAQQASGRSFQWVFAKDQGAAPADRTGGVKASLSGHYSYVPGVQGDGVRFDGYTTGMTIPAEEIGPIGREGFTVQAWVALNTYPWNWVPVIDQEKGRQIGFSFGIDPFGHIGLGASIHGQWQTVLSTASLPLKKWAYISATYETSHGQGMLTLYLDGKQVGQAAVHGELTPTNSDVVIGRVRQATMPFPEGAVTPKAPIWYSLDGILDDISIEERGLSQGEIAGQYAVAHAPAGDVLPWPKMPSGDPGPARFGAYYTTLHFEPAWDQLRRTGPDNDVVVRFGSMPIRLVFWQGTNYIPAWVTENDKWYTDEFMETWGFDGCAPGWDCEPMSDKQNRYSHVNILETGDARVVVHWRYALAEVEEYRGGWPDPRTGWFDWGDEYWTIYPDGVAVRKQVLHSSALDKDHEWQETIVLHQPGSRPEDDIHWDAVTLENMQGEQKTYRWQPKQEGEFGRPHGPGDLAGPPDLNIQWVNIKSDWKPFQIVPPGGTSANFYNNEFTYFSFECWNHWPVAQIASSDRPCVAADRPSHSSLSHLYWKPYERTADTETKILLDGLTRKSPAELLPLAKSWISPPALEIQGGNDTGAHYDPTQRAYVLGVTGTKRLTMTLAGSPQSPVFHPAFVIRGWGDAPVRLRIDGKVVSAGEGFRGDHIRREGRTDLVLWIDEQAERPVRIEVIPSDR